MLTALINGFRAVRAGNAEAEYEDDAGGREGDPATNTPARCIMVDGGTDAYDAARWAALLVDSFLGRVRGCPAPPTLQAAHLRTWFELLQDRWHADTPRVIADLFAERKLRQVGSFATLLCCEIDLDSRQPGYTAVALGDTVLFHVRDGRQVRQFPDLAADAFGTTPDSARTKPGTLDTMMDRLDHTADDLHPADRLFLATDALAEWIVRTRDREGPAVWDRLDGLRRPDEFAELVATLRATNRMRNDDVCLMRVEVAAGVPQLLEFAR